MTAQKTTLYGNGNLNEQVLIQFAKSVEPLTAPVDWRDLTGWYAVGLTSMDGAQAIGYWADDETEYVDPVRITGDREVALRLAKEHQQECVFRFKTIKQVSYHDTLRKALQYCQTTQGATVFKVRFGRNIRYAVIEAEGDLIYP